MTVSPMEGVRACVLAAYGLLPAERLPGCAERELADLAGLPALVGG